MTRSTFHPLTVGYDEAGKPFAREAEEAKFAPDFDTSSLTAKKALTIKDHIEAGHYPKDSKGRSLVPRAGNSTLITVTATDGPAEYPIQGFGAHFGSSWSAHGRAHPTQFPGNDLFPPPPRKATIRVFAAVRDGRIIAVGETFSHCVDKIRFLVCPEQFVVELTKDIEQRW
jgi:hypothetical protein